MTQPRLVRGLLLLAVLVSVDGCGINADVSHPPGQEKEIERLQTQLQDADRRLEAASNQLQAAAAHAQRLDRVIEATTEECAEIKRRAADEVRMLQAKLDSLAGELAAANKRLSEIDRNNREAPSHLSPVGMWVLDTSPPVRFLFLDNGQGVFYRWDAKNSAWKEGDLPELNSPRSNGRFTFRPGGANGIFDVNYVRRGKIDKLESVSRYPGDLFRETKRVEVNQEEPVNFLVKMNSPDAARLIGWGPVDATLRRTDESWTPQSESQ